MSGSLGTRVVVRSRWLWVWGFTALIAAGGTTAAVLGHIGGVELVFGIAVLALMSWPYMATAFTSFRRAISKWFNHYADLGLLLMVAGFILAYLLYAFGTNVFDGIALLRVTGFVGVPALLAWTAGRRADITWQDWAIVACIWLPFNFGLIDSIWEWPEGKAGYILNTPMAMDLAIFLFLGYRRFAFVPFRFRIPLRSLPLVAAMLAGFMLIALPIGLGTGFLQVNPQLVWVKLLGSPLAIFFFIAVPEEFLFRGLVQGMLTRQTGKPALAIVVTALLFGASHWHNPGMPDCRYLGLAAIAGIFYGYTCYRSGSLAVSALLHAAVDSLWDLFFHAPP